MKLLRRILPALLLLAMCVSAVSCSGDPARAIGTLRDHIRETKGVGKGLNLLVENEDVQVYTYLQAPKTEEDKAAKDQEPLYLTAMTFSGDKRYSYRLDVIMDKENPTVFTRRFTYSDRQQGWRILIAEDTLKPGSYKGSELMSFENIEYPKPTSQSGATETEVEVETAHPIPEEQFLKETARNLLNLAIVTLDTYGEKTFGCGRKDFGFTAYNEKNNPANIPPTICLPDPMNPAFLTLSADSGAVAVPDETVGDTSTPAVEETVAETEDLGGALSPARISYALRMTLLGMGMVFAVLTLLWGILSIFKLVFAGKSPKAPKASKQKSEPAPAPAAPAPIPAGTDPATVAAITAAIAAMIESDPALSEQFAGGFRVVSFKKKSGKTNWNH